MLPSSTAATARTRLFPFLLIAAGICAAFAASRAGNFAASASAARPDTDGGARRGAASTPPATLLATLVVSNTNDSGPGSLRQAILDANALPGGDLIHFQIPGSGVRTISPLTALPALTGPTTVDGTTQPGWAGTPVVELDGSQVSGAVNGLRFDGGNSLVRGLAVSGFAQGSGVLLNSTDNFVEDCVIGLAAGSGAPRPNLIGVALDRPVNVVGSRFTGLGNVIAGNETGVLVAQASNRVWGNFIGTNESGAAGIGNTVGVLITDGGNPIPISNNIIGGTESGAGNVISGNTNEGILVADHGSIIQGNFIGTDPTGTLRLANGRGITLQGRRTIVGSAQPLGRNIISGNRGEGILISTHFSDPLNIVEANFIGTNAAGTAPLPNTLAGIQINRSGNVIGGTDPGAGNLVAFNMTGVAVGGAAPALNNSIRRNRIFSNARLGIDLAGDSAAEPNDQLDADDGPNRLQNFPLITSVAPSGFNTRVQGTLDSAPDTQFHLDFFSNRACDPSGFGEGARVFGTGFGPTLVTTGADGRASFDVSLGEMLAAGRVLTATATDPGGNTSEFSPCDASQAGGSVEFEFADYRVLEDVGGAVVTVVRRGGSLGPVAVNFATANETAQAGSDYTPAAGTLDFAAGETTKSFVVPIADDGVAEPEETVRLTLSAADPEVLGGRPVASLRISDSDTPLTLSVDTDPGQPFPVPEGDSGVPQRPVIVRLSGATSRTVTVDFATFFTGGATPGVDFQHVSGSLTFAPGTGRREVLLPIIGDTLDEDHELFGLRFSNAVNAVPTSETFNVSITDDDPLPGLSVADVTVFEEAGAKAVFTVRLSAPSGRIVSVNFTTADGTATSDDYAPTSGTVFFNAGTTAATVEIPVTADAVDEPDETFTLNLELPAQASIVDGQAVATIREPASAFSFSATGYAVGEADGSAEITVNRTGDTSTAASVFYETVNQTASDRSDYTAALGRLRFAPGETSKTFRVLIIDDVYVEADETLSLVLSNQLGAALVSPSTATLLITSNDAVGGQSPVKAESFNSDFFVRQHYLDFLGREPDEDGFRFWADNIDLCGADDACKRVKRVDTSAAFFLSIEFQETGYLVYRMYKAAYGDISPPAVPVPVRLREFLADTGEVRRDVQVGVGDWFNRLEANKNAFADEFVARQRFTNAYPLTMTPAEFVEQLNQNAGGALSPPERDALVADLAAGTKTRAQVLRAVAEDQTLRDSEFRKAFVLMQYFGYLRRNPDDAPNSNFDGYNFWLQKLNDFNGDYRAAEMVRAFIESIEYGERFGH